MSNTPPWNGSVTKNGVTTYYQNGVVVAAPPTYTIPRPEIEFDLDALERICLIPTEDFDAYGNQSGKAPDRHFFADHGSNILAVAHLDSIQTEKHFVRAKVADEMIIYNAQLDDRLGAYIILDLLPSLGIQCDILLTEGEETGRSTAKNFTSDKQYNWIFSFDRMKTDVVMYAFETPKYAQMLRESGFAVGTGSFSDICYLQHLKCAGFNFGCGYQDYHSKLAHVKMSDTAKMIQSFMHFYGQHQGTLLEHKPKEEVRSHVPHHRSSWQRDDWDYDYDWRTGKQTGKQSSFLDGSKKKDNREYCNLHEGMVEPEDYVYGASCCFKCYKDYMRATEEEGRQTLDDAIGLLELEQEYY